MAEFVFVHIWLICIYDSEPAKLLCPWDFPAKNTGESSYFLLQGIFLTQGLNLGLLHCMWSLVLKADSLPTEPPGKPSNYIPIKINFKNDESLYVQQEFFSLSWLPSILDVTPRSSVFFLCGLSMISILVWLLNTSHSTHKIIRTKF